MKQYYLNYCGRKYIFHAIFTQVFRKRDDLLGQRASLSLDLNPFLSIFNK